MVLSPIFDHFLSRHFTAMGPQYVDSAGNSSYLSKNSSYESGISDLDWTKVLQDEALNDPTPSVDRFTIAMAGIALFILATIWPPLILLVTYLASILIPYSFRINDNATTRRQLIDKFEKEDDLSASMREIPDDVQLKSSYWINSRYVNWYFLMTLGNEYGLGSFSS